MARRKRENTESSIDKKLLENVKGLRAEVTEMPISVTLETNYMPYAMSVILSRAIPEIDGFKPSHRKLLYTMYKMGLLGGQKIKSANIVGQTMQLNPHGDASIYETMVRLSKGYEALNAPLVDSKGNFGKVYSRDMAYAAPRYTEAKLTEICREIFKDIDSDTVDFVPNYDNTKTEPTLLPTSYPNLLVSANTGIAVGMASNICGFNLKETCETAIALMNDPDADIMQTLKAPDFPTGGEIIMEEQKMREIYETGRGSFKIRAKWQYEKKGNLIEIREIPYTTTIEAVMDKIAELMKAGKLKEISDVRDESDLKGLLITIDLKRGADPEALMQKLFRMTPLLDSFSCNFNILIAGTPQVLGVREILDEWTAWREECVKRRVYFELKRKRERLHLLMGLSKILLDIDKAIAIIRKTELEADVIPNLMTGFGIDETQAEFVAEIKLRNINREYILKKISEKEELISDIKSLEETLRSRAKIRRLIIKELEEVIKKYGSERKSSIVYAEDIEE
ncbi:MAG: topoisomerase IV, partial [Clostridiales bacterium]|nr:topoisomerase IV [Clostridiales bacterium]